ncbi:MAG: hypothetical protein Q9M28_03590 [Mariprofundaceae bacterium]|nr:hypothetical protein [Mariprofundaceae bacterium]
MAAPKQGKNAGSSSFTSFLTGALWILVCLIIIFGGNMFIAYEVILLARDGSEIGTGIAHIAQLSGLPVAVLWVNALCAVILDLLMYLSSRKEKKQTQNTHRRRR